MNNYLHKQYFETKAKFEKFSSRLQKSQEKGEFHKLSKGKQNHLLNRVRKLWEKLCLLEVRLKITTAGAALALMLMVSNLNAQQFEVSPEKNPLPPPTVFGFDPKLVDIDMDGDLDLILDDCNYSMLFLNNGTAANPQFESVPENEDPILALENTSFDVWDLIGAADLDGDNDIDLLSDDGYIYRNIGSNSNIIFSEESLSGYLPNEGVLGDFDGDGDLDMIAPAYENFLYFYENIGDATNFDLDLSSPTPYFVGNWDERIENVDNLYVADLDGDGDLDIAMSINTYDYYDYTEAVKYVENAGTASEPSFSLLPDANNPFSILDMDDFSIGDLDNDGDYDLIFTDYYYGGGIQLLEMQGSNFVENTQLVPEFSDGIVLPRSYYFSPQFVDYDGDGDLDIFAWSYYSYNGGTIYFENTGSSTEANFVEIKDKSFGFIDPHLYGQVPFFTDLDGDGDIDVVRLSYDYDPETGSESMEYVYLENTETDENPVYFNHGDIGVLGEDEDFFMPSFVDIDNDGDMDIFATSDVRVAEYEYTLETRYFELTSLSPVSFVERTGAANPLDMLNEDNFGEMQDYARAIFTDLDKDGDFDVVFTGYYVLYYLQNIGTPTEASYVDATSGSPLPAFSYIQEGTSINLADIDVDGDDDLILHELYGMLTTFYENTDQTGGGGGPAISESQIESLKVYPNPVANELFVAIQDGARELNYSVASIEGKVIESSLVEVEVDGKFTLRTENYDPGYYIIRIEAGKHNYRATFIKN